MPTLQISESLLVNRGLGAAIANDTFNPAELTDLQPVVTDVVGSFKQLVISEATDVNLISVIGTFTAPVELATYFINAKYAQLGGPAGILGATSTAVAATANGAGFARTFHDGVIYWHPSLGAHELHGPILARWQELGAEGGFLGFPASDVTPGADVRSEGLFAHFQGGSIYWAPPATRLDALIDTVAVTNLGTIAAATGATGASATAGAAVVTAPAALKTAAKTRASRSTKSRAGATAETNLAAAETAPIRSAIVDVGAISVIGLTPLVESSAGAYEVHGAIREKYLALGAEASILGYPRTDETGTPDGIGRYNHFQGGSIYWTPGTGAHEVHGLIRDRWASQGWERNPQLGYPITDELIPDPRVGHRRPETLKKPIVALPIDVIKLPADAVTGGFPASVVNVAPAVAQPAAPVVNPAIRKAVLAAKGASGALGKLSDKSTSTATLATGTAVAQPLAAGVIDPRLISVVGGLLSPASTPGDRSLNRFGDFENGVLFWFRGATDATTLSPLASTSDGTSLSFSGTDIANAALTKIGRAVFETNNVQVASIAFVGTTGYSHDGAQVHNRCHKLQLNLQGVEVQQIGFVQVPVPVTATIELQVEVWFDASQRQIALTPVDWLMSHASSSSFAQTANTNLHARLDPLLWSRYALMTLPDTNAGKPIAVLSVKTLPGGVVSVYVEPSHLLPGAVLGQIDVALQPGVLISQPN